MLNIMVALYCEAKPLIDYFQLKKITHLNLPFPLFINKDKNIHLMITGVGKIKMAAATTFLYSWTGNKSFSCFLNVGIAGSTQFEIGEGLVVNKIIEHSTQRSCYPFASLLKHKKQSLLITHDLPQIIYPICGMVDMEGYSFFQAANYFVTQEQIQLFKVISDQNETTQIKLDEDRVKKLIKDNLDSISQIVSHLLNLSEQEYLIEKQSDFLEKFLSSWHFTHTQKLQLKEFLRRWEIQIHSEDPWEWCKNEKNAALVIKSLTQKLDNYANCLY